MSGYNGNASSIKKDTSSIIKEYEDATSNKKGIRYRQSGIK